MTRVLEKNSHSTMLSERAILQLLIEQKLKKTKTNLNTELKENPQSRLALFARKFGLNSFEVDVVALLWVSSFEPKIRENFLQYGEMSGQITPRLVSQIFNYPMTLILASHSPLLQWQWVEELPRIDATATLVGDPQLLSWLEGNLELDRQTMAQVRLVASPSIPDWVKNYDCWPLVGTLEKIKTRISKNQAWRQWVVSEDKPYAQMFSLALAENLGLRALIIEPTQPQLESSIGLRIHRQAWLFDAMPIFPDKEEIVSPGHHLPPFPYQCVIAEKKLSITYSAQNLIYESILQLPPLSVEARKSLWQLTFKKFDEHSHILTTELAEKYEITATEILRITESDPETEDELKETLKQVTSVCHDNLAQKLECAFVWDDLVVANTIKDNLLDITFEAKERHRLWAQPEARRYYPQGRGLVALFAGPPGTGKTMAAQVIASELNLDLLRIDLSSVVSKWVGETAQNIQRILSSKTARRAILFFDEADALYGKRVEETKDAQDRFANMDISHLMVALESYEGIVLLATNLKQNIDPSFIRRIRYVVDFSKPNLSARLDIWRKTLTSLLRNFPESLEQDLPKIAAIESTGAQIKNAALSACFSAQRAKTIVDINFLGHWLSKELAKEGAGLSAREIAQFLGSSEKLGSS
ncbi:MAG: ATP-binding protein [bacterium]